MKLKSLIQNSNRLEVAEVEIEFIPGIPQIHFLGLPDRIIKESFYRIKSALKSAGYKFPLTSQMIVNIKPNHLRKSSRGVELAVALGILLRSEQISADFYKPDWVIYGELGLDGEVFEPSDLAASIPYLNGATILTGKGDGTSCYRLDNIKNIEINYTQNLTTFKRPESGLNKMYTSDEAEFLFLAATSGLHALLAGDSGAGKTTLAHSLASFLEDPTSDEAVRLEKSWRPIVSPHNSITAGAFLGGGADLWEGEIERVQGGILLLDELLEFKGEILEALRGPMTGEKLRLSRAASKREIDCNFQVVATTNLCKCGKWTPNKQYTGCRFPRAKCAAYLERFSGPLLDRFAILLFTGHEKKRTIKGTEIFERVKRYFGFAKRYQESLEIPVLFDSYYSSLSSRRKNYLGVISRIFAIDRHLDAQGTSGLKPLKIDIKDINRAEQWVIRPFEQLDKGMS